MSGELPERTPPVWAVGAAKSLRGLLKGFVVFKTPIVSSSLHAFDGGGPQSFGECSALIGGTLEFPKRKDRFIQQGLF